LLSELAPQVLFAGLHLVAIQHQLVPGVGKQVLLPFGHKELLLKLSFLQSHLS
jgi:hypothetical protein